VFISLTEGRGTSNARLKITHDESGQVIGDVTGQIQFPDIHAVVEINFNLVGLVFPQPGLYSIEFYCDDALVLERRSTFFTPNRPKARHRPKCNRRPVWLGPLNQFPKLVEQKPASCGPGDASGWYCTPKTGYFLWRIPSIVRSFKLIA